MKETGKEENSLQAARCVCECVCVCILQREFCVVSGWVRQSVGLGSLQCTQPLCSPLGWVETSCVCGTLIGTACFSELRPEEAVQDRPRKTEGVTCAQTATRTRLLRGKEHIKDKEDNIFLKDTVQPPGYSMIILWDLAMPCWPRETDFLLAVSRFLWRIILTCVMWMWLRKGAAPSLPPHPLEVVHGLG